MQKVFLLYVHSVRAYCASLCVVESRSAFLLILKGISIIVDYQKKSPLFPDGVKNMLDVKNSMLAMVTEALDIFSSNKVGLYSERYMT